ncbi:hypothetical protein [Photobacterium sp. DNB22_13_2]
MNTYKFFVDDSGNVFLPTSVSIPKGVTSYFVDSLPDIDTHLYINGQFIRKADAERIEADMVEASRAEQLRIILSKRYKAYLSESDPLYMEWQYDQTSEKEQAWRDKVAEIKARYPLPTE